ncbi:MAG: TonB-dependent receptor [Cyclobacteriaceae bacterium]
MRKVWSAVVLLIIYQSSISQTISITNRATLEPIADVFLYHENQTNTAFSDAIGQVDISDFPESGVVIFQHPNFVEKRIDITKIKEQKDGIQLVERIIQFDEVTVTSNRWEQDQDEVSQEILTINSKSISFQNSATSADLLAQSGEVFVQKSQLGGGSPMLRGFSANSVLLVLDGVRLNNAIYRSGNLQNVINIDPNALSNTEVIYGPGSVMYGSDAMGGVMDFHTKKLDFIDEGKSLVQGSAFGRFSSAAQERTGSLNLSVTGKKLSFFGTISSTSLSDLQAGKNRSSGYQGYFNRNYYVKTLSGNDILLENQDLNDQVGSGFDMLNLTGKIGLKTSDHSRLEYGAYYSTTSDIPRYDRLNLENENDSLVFAEWYYGPQQWMMHNLNYTLFKPTSLFNQAKIIAAYQNYQESRNDRRFGNTSLRTTSELVDLYTVSVDFDKEFSRSSLYYGYDFFYNYVRSKGIRKDIVTGATTPTSSRYPNQGSQYFTSALYANYIYRLSERLSFNGGIRLSAVNLKAKTNDSSASSLLLEDLVINNQAINGVAGLVFKANDRSTFNALFSSGFRAPNVDDVGKLFEIDDEIVVVPNPDLKPEFSYNQEVSYQYRTEYFVLDAVAFHSLLTNAIVRGEYQIDGADTITLDGENKEIRAQINANKARIYGSSIKVSTEINKYLGATASITFTEGFVLDSKEPLRHIPPTFGRISVIHQARKLKSELYSEFNLTKRSSDIPDSEIIDKSYLYTSTGTPSWATINLKSQYTFSEHITMQIGLENILDQHYRPYSSGISAPGRNLILTVRGKF